MNVTRARVRGLEAEGSLHLKASDMGISYTFLDTKDMETHQKIRYTSRHQLKGTTAVYPRKGMTAALEVSYVTNYVVRQGDPRCYFLLDGKISQKIKMSDNISGELFITGKNILDRQFQTVKDYPMPPRQFIGGISFNF